MADPRLLRSPLDRVLYSVVGGVLIVVPAPFVVVVLGEPRRAWGLAKFGQFGLVTATGPLDDVGQDGPRRLRDGYRELRRTWTRRR